jgi:curli biogenesis system outer membrane secretion channel CsgG
MQAPGLRLLAVGCLALGLGGCAFAPGIDLASQNAALVEGPPITDIVTPFDEALMCLKGRVQPEITFAVGAILDSTGKEQFTEGGAGKFVTQGAGEIVQSALFRAGVTVMNRRDPRIITTEAEWGIRGLGTQVPVDYFVTGSINSLDFIPGGGFSLQVSGVGPRYRQNRILVGMDLSVTQTRTGLIVANVPLQKQIFASEAGVGIGRFFGETLVSFDLGGMEREALNYALRQMLNLATFDLLTQLMSPQNYLDCQAKIDAAFAPDAAAEAASGAPAPAQEPAATPAPAAGAEPPLGQGLQPTNGGAYGETAGDEGDLERKIITDDYSSGGGESEGGIWGTPPQ